MPAFCSQLGSEEFKRTRHCDQWQVTAGFVVPEYNSTQRSYPHKEHYCNSPGCVSLRLVQPGTIVEFLSIKLPISLKPCGMHSIICAYWTDLRRIFMHIGRGEAETYMLNMRRRDGNRHIIW